MLTEWGLVGSAARGIVFGVVGVFLVVAAVTFDAKKAQGLDGALRQIAATPLGPWLHVAVALGLVTFRVYSCCEARWRNVQPGEGLRCRNSEWLLTAGRRQPRDEAR